MTEPAETAVAGVFAHTAVLAGRPDNVEPLRHAGRAFGRIAHLVDAVQDLDADRRSGTWNPLSATGAGATEARRLCDEALAALRTVICRAWFADGRLVHLLLAHEIGHAIHRAFRSPATALLVPGLASRPTYPPPPPPQQRDPGDRAAAAAGGHAAPATLTAPAAAPRRGQRWGLRRRLLLRLRGRRLLRLLLELRLLSDLRSAGARSAQHR